MGRSARSDVCLREPAQERLFTSVQSTSSEPQTLKARMWSGMYYCMNSIDRKAHIILIERRPWLPITLRTPFLLGFSTICLLLIVCLELLSKQSLSHGGILFASSDRGLGSRQAFSYLYLPTAIAVTGSLAWSWIDLDVKRLEGFLQLSNPGGASGSNSILLQYPVEFLAFVPFSAAKKR